MSESIERIKAHADALGSVPHNQQFRADLYDLLAQLSEAQARLALHDETAVALSRLAGALHGKGDRRGVLHHVPAALENANAVLAKLDSTAATAAQPACLPHDVDPGQFDYVSPRAMESLRAAPAAPAAQAAQPVSDAYKSAAQAFERVPVSTPGAFIGRDEHGNAVGLRPAAQAVADDVVLPEWDSAADRCESNEGSALDRFIWANEPAGDADHWRYQLQQVIDEVLAAQQQAAGGA